MINMKRYSEHDVYLPPANYVSSDVFPEEWMQIFAQVFCNLEIICVAVRN